MLLSKHLEILLILAEGSSIKFFFKLKISFELVQKFKRSNNSVIAYINPLSSAP